MSDIELEGVYPIDDPNNLPIRTVDLGQGIIFVKGNVDDEDIFGLADVSVEKDVSIVHVRFSVWEDSGNAERLDRQLLIGSMSPAAINPETGEPIQMGKPIHVFDPYEVRVWHIGEDLLPELVEQPDGHFWQVARFFGADRIRSAFLEGVYPDPLKLKVEYQGLQRFEQPKRMQFGLSEKADLYVGNLNFDVSIPSGVPDNS